METPGFVRCVAGGVPHYRCQAFEELPFVRHGFSLRAGTVGPPAGAPFNLGRTSADEFGRVEENRRRFLCTLGLSSARLATLRQVHSDRLLIIEDYAGGWNPGPEGDALATRRAGIVLAVQVADCYPLLVADPATRMIAALHAGWRGVLAGIVTKTMRALHLWGCDPGELLVAVGPGIGPCCMEVGPEVARAFEDAWGARAPVRPHPERGGKYMLDLPAALGAQLRRSGVAPERVFMMRACTRCRSDLFFSYRAEGARAGRMMAAIALK